MNRNYMVDDSDSVVFPLLLIAAMVLVGKLLAVMNILTTRNGTTLAKYAGAICGVIYGSYMSSCCTVNGPKWMMFIVGSIFFGAIAFGAAFLGFSFVAKEPKK